MPPHIASYLKANGRSGTGRLQAAKDAAESLGRLFPPGNNPEKPFRPEGC